jgi:hypothetical protein
LNKPNNRRRRKIRLRRARRVLDHLSRIDILRALPPEEILALVPHVEHMVFPPGACLMREGEPGDALYLVERGEARVHRSRTGESWQVGAGTALGEAALLTGDVRSATVTAESELAAWRIKRETFAAAVNASPALKQALEALMHARSGGVPARTVSAPVWVSTALRAAEARSREIHPWQWLMAIGVAAWLALLVNDLHPVVEAGAHPRLFAALNLAIGLLILQGACEAFLHGVERLGARLHWDGFISGTVGSALSTLPEFVVIAFLVLVDPMIAFVTAMVTIFNNALVFSVYSFFLPKDPRGAYAMPRSLSTAGGEILIAGSAITLIIGIVMITERLENQDEVLSGGDLIAIGVLLIAIYVFYLITLVRYYGEGQDDRDSMPPDPNRLGHDTRWQAVLSMMLLGTVGAYCGGEAIGQFAGTAIEGLGMPMIPTAAGLALFAGVSEYIIVYKSHRRGELGIALSNAFGGLSQVMFLLLPFGLLVIGIAGYVTADPKFAVPVNAVSILLMLLLFPLFYALHQCMAQDKSLSNLDAAAMTGIYLLLLYFLFTTRV